MKFYSKDGIHLDSQEKLSCEPLILGALIKIDNSGTSSTSVASISTAPSATTEKDSNELKGRQILKLISRLPKHIDPNIGLTGYLPPLNMAYETKMNQPWNIAPYFLDILTQSPCCDLSDCILLFGGLDPTRPDDFVLGSSIFEYHTTFKKWRYYGCMMEPRCYHQTVQTNSAVYVTGGYSLLQRAEGEMVAMASMHRLDIKNTLWGRCADMKTARAAHAMVAVNENLYVFGGRDSNGDILTSVEMYDPNENSWTEISNLPVPLMGLSATYVRGKIWLVGGITSQKPDHQNASVVATVYSFSPVYKSWCSGEPLPGPHAFASCVSNQDSMWVTGGSHFSKSVIDKSLISCPCIWQLSFPTSARLWKKVGYLPTPTHAGTTVMCGDLLISLGGIHSLSRNATSAVQVFNTKLKSFEQGAKLPAKIVGSSAVYFPRKPLDDEDTDNSKSTVLSNGTAPKQPLQTTSSEISTLSGGNTALSQQDSKSQNTRSHSASILSNTSLGSVSYRAEPPTSLSSASMLPSASERKLKDASKATVIHPPIDLTIQAHTKAEKSLSNNTSNISEMSSHAKKLSAANIRQYVTTLEIPLNGGKIYASDDLSKSDFTETGLSESKSSGSTNFKLYSPPPKWKERREKSRKKSENS